MPPVTTTAAVLMLNRRMVALTEEMCELYHELQDLEDDSPQWDAGLEVYDRLRDMREAIRGEFR